MQHGALRAALPLDQDWHRAEAVEGSVPDFVADLKRRDGAGIGVLGSIALAQSLLLDYRLGR